MLSFRLISILFLGFSSGLPLALTGSTLQAWLTVENVDIKTIGLYSVVGFPYTYKFLWSPLLDYLNPGFFDRRRAWIVLAQLMCAGLIAAMAILGASSVWALAGVAAGLAFFSSTQDMAIDAYRTELLPANERGLGAAYYVTGYRLAMLVSGGLALVIAGEWLGWHGTFLLMAGLMVMCAALTSLAPTVCSNLPTEKPRLSTIIRASLTDFFTREKAIWLLVLIVLYKLGDAFAGALTTSFLLKGLGFSLTEVGAINKTVSLVASLTGAVAGGALMSRIGLFRSLLFFGVLQALSNLSFWILSWSEPNIWSMAAAIAAENLCGGLGTAAFVGLLTGLCNKQFSATQYALLSSLASFGRVYLSAPAGYVVASVGWGTFFVYSTLAAIPGLVALVLLRRRVEAIDQQQ